MAEQPRWSRAVDRLLSALAWLPLPILHIGGAALGRALAYVPNRARHIAHTNLTLCFPQMSEPQRRRLLKSTLQEAGKAALELGPIFKRRPERLERWVRRIHGQETLEAAIAQGRGVLVLAPRLGAWELLNLWVAARYPLTALYRPPRQPSLEPILVEARARNGARIAPAGRTGVRALLEALARNEVAGILPDQEPDGNEPFAPFFGVPAKTMTLAGRIAARSGAVPVFAFAERLPTCRGFELHFVPAEQAIADPDPQVATAALNRGIEACARQAPSQYQWTYKRFKTQPDGARVYRRARG